MSEPSKEEVEAALARYLSSTKGDKGAMKEALEAAAKVRQKGERVVYTCESPYVSINMRQVVEVLKQNGVHTMKRGEELVIRPIGGKEQKA